jgi:hypothetical protein
LLKLIIKLYKSSLNLNIKDTLINKLLICFNKVLSAIYNIIGNIKYKTLKITSFKLKALLLN